MLTDESKNEMLQIINNVNERLTHMSHKLEDNDNITNHEWNYYNDQFIKIYLRMKQLEETILGA